MNNTSRPGLIDLHTHTTASDGTLSPSELVRAAADVGIEYLGIADHDTTNGLAEALAEAENVSGLIVIPGVELSGTSTHGGPFHLLGYGIDPAHVPLQAALDSFRQDRERRVELIVQRLRQAGIDITQGQIEANAQGGAISRAHIGRVLMELGEVETIDQAFSLWLGRNRPAFVPRAPLFVPDALRLVHEAGGVAVLAHPLSMGDYRRQLPELIEHGLAGIEVYYGAYDDAQRSMLAGVASNNGLIATGGSDFHGSDLREGRELGQANVPETVIEDLRGTLGGQWL